ncbi:hypothetical protein [Streptococcus hyointestinalis]|uniref:hypothetical protein n=1 Tax=Streptococcus hyointestinalis TaxID=1337 RepID=UPI0013E0CCB7|nr:hypothetical protein [Streptococcus hyointestinalis]
MIDELNLSPMGYLVFFVVAMVLLIVAIRRESYFTLDSEPLEPRENSRDEVVGARYGAVMQIERH